MGADYTRYLDKLVSDSIDVNCRTVDMLCGLKEISCKLDTIISLLRVELSRQQQPQVRQSQKADN